MSRKLTAVLSFRGILEERRIIFFDCAVLKGIFILFMREVIPFAECRYKKVGECVCGI